MKYEKEVAALFERVLREGWETDEDWAEFIAMMKNNPAQSGWGNIERDIEIGIRNGFSVEQQLAYCEGLLRKLKAADEC
jgi:hypothetical protein